MCGSEGPSGMLGKCRAPPGCGWGCNDGRGSVAPVVVNGPWPLSDTLTARSWGESGHQWVSRRPPPCSRGVDRGVQTERGLCGRPQRGAGAPDTRCGAGCPPARPPARPPVLTPAPAVHLAVLWASRLPRTRRCPMLPGAWASRHLPRPARTCQQPAASSHFPEASAATGASICASSSPCAQPPPGTGAAGSPAGSSASFPHGAGVGC